MNCLVLGGSGFIGSHIVEELLMAQHNVRLLTKTRRHISEKFDRAVWHIGDFSNEGLVQEALEGIDVLVHSVSTTLPKSSNEDPVYDIESNITSTVKLLQAAVRQGVKKVVFLSSGGTIYGSPSYLPIDEAHPTEPISSYGIHKLTLEKYLNLFHHLYGLDYCILRVSNPYGPRQMLNTGQGVIGVFVNKALNKEPIEIWGDGSVVRDYIYVSDVANAVVKLIDYDGPHKLFNVGSGEGYSLLQIIDKIAESIGTPINVIFKESRSVDVPVNILDVSRATFALGWTPLVSIEDGLLKTVSYFKTL